MTAADRAVTDELPRVRWWERRTLRFRVIASLLATMIAAFAVIGVVTVVTLTHFLTGRVDQQIGNAGSRYVTDYDDAIGQAEGTLRAKVVDGQLVDFGIVGIDPTSIPNQDQQIVTTLAVGSSESRDLGPFGDYRLHGFRAPDGGTVVVGLPLRALHETVAELLAAELIAFAVVLIATVAGSRWLIALSLRPLARVTSTARDVAATPLSDTIELPQRVPIADPTTEVGQLADAFNHMLDHVESSLITRRDTEDRLRRFIADASHELRTPVASIRGHAESVRHAPDEVPAVVAASLRRIESEAARMGVLVDDLLLLARLDAGRPLDSVPVDLTRVAIDAVNDARVAGPDHRWVLDLPESPVSVMGDEHRLLELVTNLLTNAKVHTPAGTRIELGLTYDEVTRNAVLNVSDDGPGIPAAAQPKVFERFFRADAGRAPMTGSSGLGLAIVAAVAHAHGGSVTVDSRPGRTRFEVTLPATSEPIGADESS